MTAGAAAQDWHQILARRSFLEGDALERAAAHAFAFLENLDTR